jgi:hypothetical protein
MSTPSKAGRQHRVLVGALMSLAVVVSVAAVVAIWVNRQVLDTDAWTNTSGKLLEDKRVQAAVSAYMVDELFSKVDVAGEIEAVLPPQAAALAGPAAAGLEQLADRLAPRLIARPKVQEAWRIANRVAHRQALQIINGGNDVVSTTNGEVVLNVRPLVDRLGKTLGVEEQVTAARAKLQGPVGDKVRGVAQQKLGFALPASSGQIVIMRAKNLKLAHDVANTVSDLAIILTLLMLLLFASAIWFARGWRRVALRTTGWCFIAVGSVLLLIRHAAGGRIVDSLVASESVKPAGNAAWEIATTLLYDICIAAIFYGVVFVIAAWLAGATRPAVALRRELAPAMRFHLVSVYGTAVALYILVLAWGPTPALRKPFGIILFAGLIILGIEMLRRQVRRDHPDVRQGESGERMRERFSSARGRARSATSRTPREAKSSVVAGDRLAELEALANLHDRGVLSDEEFDSQKVVILNGS